MVDVFRKQAEEWFERGRHDIETAQLLYDRRGYTDSIVHPIQQAVDPGALSKYILEHPEFADQLPNNALVVMQIDGDEEFNGWARETAQQAAEKGMPIVYIKFSELKPVRSRIEKVTLELVA